MLCVWDSLIEHNQRSCFLLTVRPLLHAEGVTPIRDSSYCTSLNDSLLTASREGLLFSARKLQHQLESPSLHGS